MLRITQKVAVVMGKESERNLLKNKNTKSNAKKIAQILLQINKLQMTKRENRCKLKKHSLKRKGNR